jgi:predicted nucleotidyltransferase
VTEPLDPLLAKLRAEIARVQGIRVAVLFGSHATGKNRPGSDVDVAILPSDPGMPLTTELELASALSAATGAEVDLVRMDADAPLLSREIARSGVCIYESCPGAFAAWRAMAISYFIELDEMLAPHRERFLRRLAGARS